MSKIVLTGGTGYIGRRLLARLLRDRSESILVPVRASSSPDFQRRCDLLKAYLANEVKADQIQKLQCFPSDLADLLPHLEAHKNSISMIIHNAAKTAFSVDETTANAVNRDSSLQLMEWSQDCAELKSFIYVSTLYASGMTAGPIAETFFPRSVFANHYERSKWEVEEALRACFTKLPWTIARVATVLCDDFTGKVVQQNAIHNTLKLFYYGLISLLPGRADTPIHFVDGDFVTESLATVVDQRQPHKIYHISYDQQASIQLGALIDLAFEEFNQDEHFKSRRLLKPLFTDEKSFEIMVNNIKGFGGTVLNQGLSSISPFGRQLYVEKEVSNTHLRGLLDNYKSPDMRSLVKKTCHYLVQTKFSKDPGGLL
jgi:thioester reductase-like protein